MKRVHFCCCAVFPLLIFVCGWAQANEVFSKRFAQVDEVRHDESAMILGDVYAKLALNVKVYQLDGSATNRYAVKVGQKVTYEYKTTQAGTHLVSAIWLLPKNTVDPELHDD